jgi:hypothetical protein
MKFMTTAKYSWMDNERNKHILKEAETEPTLHKLLKYKTRWIKHINRMQRDRLPKY